MIRQPGLDDFIILEQFHRSAFTKVAPAPRPSPPVNPSLCIFGGAQLIRARHVATGKLFAIKIVSKAALRRVRGDDALHRLRNELCVCCATCVMLRSVRVLCCSLACVVLPRGAPQLNGTVGLL